MVTQPASVQSVIDELNAELLAAYTMIGKLRGSLAVAAIQKDFRRSENVLSSLLQEASDHIADFDSCVSAIRAQRDSAPDPMESLSIDEPIPYLPV